MAGERRARWPLRTRASVLLLPLIAACAEDPAREAEAFAAAWQAQAASLGALGARRAAEPPAPWEVPPPPGAVASARPAAARVPAPPAGGLEPLPVVPRAPAPAAAAELLGAPVETVLARLGIPSLRRQEGDAQVWLYAGRDCHLDLIFYPTASGLRVGHARARAGGVAQRSEGACLRELAGERPAPRRPPPRPAAEPSARAGGLAS